MIYLDNSATTALCPEAANAMQQVMEETYGNPSSLHAAGIAAEKIVAAARSDVLAALGVRGDGRQLVFCGSGSEANNLALIGSYTAKRRRAGARVILTAGEHASTEAAERCARHGRSRRGAHRKRGARLVDAGQQ